MANTTNGDTRSPMVDFNLLQYAAATGHPAANFTHGDDEGASGLLSAAEMMRNIEPNGSVASGGFDGKGEPCLSGENSTTATSNMFCGVPCSVESKSMTMTSDGTSVTPQCLEDYKCPICLDTFINTVKVDCSYGHKFCNFCIQCWINFERHLVTECPVCRGPIFGKRLDLKTDAEIRAIYDSLPEDEKRSRLLAIKERLQMEYPNSNAQQMSTEFPIPMRFSDTPHHHLNHDLNIPIPLVGVLMENDTMQYANAPQETFGATSLPPWSQGMLYPSAWNVAYSRDAALQNFYQAQPPIPAQSSEQADADVHHQHFHHQNQENSRWDNNLYITPEDTAVPTGPTSSRQIHAHPDTRASQYQSLDQILTSRQNHLHDAAFRAAISYHPPHQSLAFSNILEDHHNNMQLNSSMLNFQSSMGTRPTLLGDSGYPIFISTHAQVSQIPSQPSHLNGFPCCYLSACPGHHCTTPTTQFISHSIQQGAASHLATAIGTCGQRHPQMQLPSTSGSTLLETNSPHNVCGNAAAISHMPPRIRPNMPGTSSNSTSIQLPSPNSAPDGRSRTQASSSNYIRATTNGNAQSGLRQPVVSACPVRNTRAHFSGGFSLFSSGYMGFQISHVPTTMMVADRYVSTPPARLTHPLVSLVPLNQDGSSTRVCLTFEVHRA